MSKRSGSEHTSIVVVGVVTFLIIFALIGYFRGVDHTKSVSADQASKIHHENTESRIAQSCNGLSGIDLSDCVNRQITTSGEYQRAEQDKAAQEKMALWALWLLILTAVTSGVSVVAVVFVAQTLKATRDTLAQTAEANAIMRQEQRPWLKIPNVSGTLSYDSGRLIFSCVVEIENIGKSIARSVSIDARLIESDRDISGVGNEELISQMSNRRGVQVFTKSVFPSDIVKEDKTVNCSLWQENSFYEKLADFVDGTTRSLGTYSAYEFVVWVRYSDGSGKHKFGSGGILSFPMMKMPTGYEGVSVTLDTSGKIRAE